MKGRIMEGSGGEDREGQWRAVTGAGKGMKRT
jgi:hypothetical protein